MFNNRRKYRDQTSDGDNKCSRNVEELEINMLLNNQV